MGARSAGCSAAEAFPAEPETEGAGFFSLAKKPCVALKIRLAFSSAPPSGQLRWQPRLPAAARGMFFRKRIFCRSHKIMLFFPVYHIVILISTLFCVTIAYISEHAWNGLSMVLFGLSSSSSDKPYELLRTENPSLLHSFQVEEFCR